MDAVKMEGGFSTRVKAVTAVVEAGVAVMGHVGLTPQAISVLGGFRPAAQSAVEALRVIKEAKALEAAGCFALVLECVPEMVAAAVTREISIPTIGIGAGLHCSGQVGWAAQGEDGRGCEGEGGAAARATHRAGVPGWASSRRCRLLRWLAAGGYIPQVRPRSPVGNRIAALQRDPPLWLGCEPQLDAPDALRWVHRPALASATHPA